MKYMMILSWIVIFWIASCSKEKINLTPELEVSTEKIALSDAGEEKVFHVKSNVDWSVASSEPWLSLTPSTGGNGTYRIEATASANSETGDRRAVIIVSVDNLSREIEVVQTAAILFSVSEDEYTVEQSVQEVVFTVESNAPYTLAFDGDWMSRKSEPVLTGTSYQETIAIKENRNIFERKGAISIKQGDETVLVAITQEGSPLTVAPVTTGVSANAMALGAKLRVGWNLGNSLEAAASSTSAGETMWGNPRTTKAMIDAVKAAGFNAIRIPCAWSGYIEDQTTHQIRDSWLERVKEVVDYCVDNEMYAIINIHWDGGWLEEHPLYAHQTEVNAKQKALWEQISTYFRDYDELLLFAGTNEVRANYNTPTAEHVAVQQSYNQTFVDAVRSTGGRNAYRNLIVQSYNTNIRFAVDYMEMPTDRIADRLMTEVHFYDPYDFCLDVDSDKYLWGAEFAGSPNVPAWGQEAWVDKQFLAMKTHFVDKGIPVILGEYGVAFRSGLTDNNALQNHKKSRNTYLQYTTHAAKRHGLIPFYWDNGVTGNNGFGLFNRNTHAIVDQEAVDAIMAGVQ